MAITSIHARPVFDAAFSAPKQGLFEKGQSDSFGESFKDMMPQTLESTPGLLPLHKTKSMTYEQALHAANEMLKGVYTHIAETMFDNSKPDDEEETSGIPRRLFAEEMGKMMGAHPSITHQRIVESLMAKNQTENTSKKDVHHGEKIAEGAIQTGVTLHNGVYPLHRSWDV